MPHAMTASRAATFTWIECAKKPDTGTHRLSVVQELSYAITPGLRRGPEVIHVHTAARAQVTAHLTHALTRQVEPLPLDSAVHSAAVDMPKVVEIRPLVRISEDTRVVGCGGP